MGAVGWVIATGVLTAVNEIYLQDGEKIDFVRVPVATAGAVAAVSLIAKASPELANMIGIIAFVTVFLAPVRWGGVPFKDAPAPAETLLKIATRWKVV